MSEGFIRALREVPTSPLSWPADFDWALDKRRPLCGLLALAIVCDITIKKATADYQHVIGKTKRSSWKGYTQHKHYADVIKHNWKRCEWRKVPEKPILRVWVDRCTVKGRTYLVRVSGHVMVVKDGWVVDQWHRAPAGEHRAKRRFVTDIWEILP
jgi:hypothetical protein